MDKNNLEAEQPKAWDRVDQLRPDTFELPQRGRQVRGLERDMVHSGTAAREEATDRSVSARRRHELEATVADEHRGGLDTLLDERLSVLEPRAEEPFVCRDRLVEVRHCDAQVMDAAHPRDATAER